MEIHGTPHNVISVGHAYLIAVSEEIIYLAAIIATIIVLTKRKHI
jgi:hypothetical protein